MALIKVGLSGTTVTFDSSTVTVTEPETITWSPASADIAIVGVSVNPPLPNSVEPVLAADGVVWTAVDSDSSAMTYSYMASVSFNGSTYTSDPEIVNSPPSGSGG